MAASSFVTGLVLAIAMRNIPAFFVGGILGGYIPYFLVSRSATSRMKRMAEQLPDALERLVSGGVKGKLALAVDPAATR